MQIIPVIDLMGGEAVHATGGERAGYRPISTPLCSTAEPLAVVRAYQALYPFEALYIADLDAIGGAGDNEAAAAQIEAEHPELTLWVDRGLRELDDCRGWIARHPTRMLVLGSESQRDAGTVAAMARGKEKDSVALSLDYRGERFLGPAALASVTALWPGTVIAMTLGKVGSDAGPDLERLRAVQRRAGPQRRVYAAGGVRNGDDLARLAEAGIAGALIASALHHGRLGRDELARLSEA
jgi:phosphoribosylformimino-5-aminoimidazole carboxamide ribotide isomerase